MYKNQCSYRGWFATINSVINLFLLQDLYHICLRKVSDHVFVFDVSILPLFLDCSWFGLRFVCLPPVSCVPNLTTVSGLFMIRFVFCLSSSCILCAQSYPCFWIVHDSVFSSVYLLHIEFVVCRSWYDMLELVLLIRKLCKMFSHY